VHIDPADLAFTHVVHHRNPEGQGRVGFFFTTTRWSGKPNNREPHKCAGLPQFLWGSLLLRLRSSLMATLFLWWLWCNRCCETDDVGVG
jgi:hypothetical protein